MRKDQDKQNQLPKVRWRECDSHERSSREKGDGDNAIAVMRWRKCDDDERSSRKRQFMREQMAMVYPVRVRGKRCSKRKERQSSSRRR